MAELISIDLKKMSPEDADQIEENLNRFKREILEIQTEYEKTLIEVGAFSVIALTSDFIYLTDGLNLDVAAYHTKDSFYWEDSDLQELADEIEMYDIPVVICRVKPNDDIAAVIKEAEANWVVLSTLESGTDPYQKQMKKNLEALVEAFR